MGNGSIIVNIKRNILIIMIMTAALMMASGCSGKDQTNPSQGNLPETTTDSSQNNPLSKDNSFIFPESATKKLTEDQIRGLETPKLALARNEIYARRGYVFQEAEYKNYFAQKTWYKPDINFQTDDLTTVEQYNVSLIKFFEDTIAKYAKQYGQSKQISNVYKLGQNVSLDMNGDGKTERILCQKENDKVIVTINGNSLKIDSDNPSEYWAVVDIDQNDSYKEIALGDYGPSDDLTTFFCFYDGKTIINMGKTGGLYNIENTLNGSVAIDGSGKISAMARSRILQTWFYSKEFSIAKDHRLQEVPQVLYTAYPADYDVFVLQPLKLYLNKGDNTPVLLIHEGQTLKITGTDDQAWCLLETTDGKKSWIAVDNYDTLRNNGLKARETFAGLNYAD